MPEEMIRGIEQEQTRTPANHEPNAERAAQRPEVDHWPQIAGASAAGHGSSAVRASGMQAMQQAYGNRAVQRYMGRSGTMQAAPLPVQRDDEEDPNKPSFRPWLPELRLPFGGGFGFKGEGKGIGLDYKGNGASGGIGYDYGGAFTAEGGFKSPFGKSSLGLEFDPWKKEGSAGLKLGDFWMKGQYDDKGLGFGFGYGSPLITPPGFPAIPGDPSKDWRKGEVGPGMFGPPGDIEKDKKSWGIGGGLGRDKDGNPFPWLGFGGYW
jgi:hypothetical protein